MGSKETAATLPVAILLYEFFFFPSGEKRLKGLLYYFVPLFLMVSLIPLSLMNTNRPLGELIGDMATVTKETMFISRSDYFLTQMKVIATYVRLLLFPVNQNLDYNYPIYNSITLEVFPAILLHLSLIGLAVYLFKQSRKTGNGIFLPISFGITWFYLTLSVESSVIPIRDVIFEHRLYLPAVGAFMAVGTGILYMLFLFLKIPLNPPFTKGDLTVPPFNKGGWGGIWIPVALILILLSAATVHRNLIWKSPLTLWSDVVKKSPKNGRGHNLLGVAYRDQGLIEEAFREYQRALSLEPEMAEAHANIGVIYGMQGNYDEAIRELGIAIKYAPERLEPKNSLGLAYLRTGRVDEAIETFEAVIKANEYMSDAYYNLGLAYKTKGLKDKAIRAFAKVLELNPGDVEAREALESLYSR